MKVALVVAFAALFSAAAVSSAQAQAVHIDDASCTLLDANGNFIDAETVKIVINNSPKGSTTSCTAKVVNNTGGSVFWSYENTGISCGVDPCNVTTAWKETISSSGNAKLVCQCNPGN